MNDFLNKDEEQAVVEAISEEEQRSRGEIRVCVCSRWIMRPEAYARKMFAGLGMAETEERNGALIVVVPRRHRFVVLGDEGLDGVVGPGYWEGIAAEMSAHLKQGRRVEALVAGVRTLGATMAEHWPSDGGGADELSNDIVFDG
ncbi:MAG: TPM domain-containing protein [Verrucomicrobiales bacterium]|nr:TPM domain-containing protein [Verrucomicrobiota bacterium JB025]